MAAKLAGKGDFEQAGQVWQRSFELARAQGDKKTALESLVGRASSLYRLYSNREAIRVYLEALDLARRDNNREMESIVASNIASLQLSLGEPEKAKATLSPYPADGSSLPEASRLGHLLIRGNIYSGLKDYPAADTYYAAALQQAEQSTNASLPSLPADSAKKWSEAPRELRRAWVFEVFGQSLLGRADYTRAEEYLLQAFRLKTTFEDPNRFKEAVKLAILMRQRGDLEGAKKLLTGTRDLIRKWRGMNHLMASFKEEAVILLAQNRSAEAMLPLHQAMDVGRAWRMETLPVDSTYLRFESYLNTELHQLFLHTFAVSSDQPALARLSEEAFWVAEETRFASMRAAQFPASAFRERLPAEYWVALSQYEALQSASLGGSPGDPARILEIEERLNLLELRAGLAIPHAQQNADLAFKAWQQKIPADELVFSFYFDEPYSLAWTVSRSSLQVRRIAGRQKLRKLIQDFRLAVLHPSQEGKSSTGMELGRQLFGDFLYTHRTTPIWTVVLDDELSSLPLAAIPTGGNGSRYLVEDHALRVLPSAIHLRPQPSEEWRRQAIAFSDPVYNAADERSKDVVSSPLRKAKFDPTLQLSRLPLTAQEVESGFEACRRAGFQIQSFAGASVGLANLREAIAASPDILHLATHIVSGPEKAQQSFVALSASELFGPLDLNANRTSTRLVVLSGCNSSAGEMIPGLGVAGLSRAWLIAGASSVIATLWPTKDVPGPLFPVFYEELLAKQWSSRAAALALQQAQKRMLQRQDWYSQPAYWAAYIPLSRG